jgi:hypothetical protein
MLRDMLLAWRFQGAISWADARFAGHANTGGDNLAAGVADPIYSPGHQPVTGFSGAIFVLAVSGISWYKDEFYRSGEIEWLKVL